MKRFWGHDEKGSYESEVGEVKTAVCNQWQANENISLLNVFYYKN